MTEQPEPRSRRPRFTGRRVAVVRRLWRTAEAPAFQIEQRLIDDKQQPDEQERDARTLAVLAKTLRDLDALDETGQGGKSTEGIGNPTAHAESAPRDVDELRRSLTRKLDALIAEQQASLPGEAN